MIGTIPVLLIYAFMAWTGKDSLLHKCNLAESFIVLFAGSTIKLLRRLERKGPNIYRKPHFLVGFFPECIAFL
jgi:hypothetical protein